MVMKKTEFGLIPEEWDIAKLGECLTKKPMYGINAPSCEYSPKLPKYIRITDITDEGQFSKENLTSVNSTFSDNYHLGDGDVVFARTGASVGKSYLYSRADGDLVFAGFLIKASVNSKRANPRYVFESVHTKRYWDWVQMTSMRSGQPGINGEEYVSFSFPLPSLPEQDTIAEVLSDMDSLIASLEKLIAKKKAIKQGAMQELLTGKERLPGFGGEWVDTIFGNCFDKIVGGGTPSRVNPLFWGGNIPWATVKDFSTFVRRKTQEYITELGLENSATHLITKGIPIIATRMGLGRIVIYDVDVAINQDLKALFINDSNDVRYIVHWFEYNNKLIESLGTGSTVKGIRLEQLTELPIIVPEKKEQTAIATILSDMDAEIEQLEKKLAKYRLIKQGMMQELLTGRIRLV
jgi:type I restriction enzyme S subunit